MNTRATVAAQRVMMMLADNTPRGPVEYEQCLKVVTDAIAGCFPEPSVPVSELVKLRLIFLQMASDEIKEQEHGTIASEAWYDAAKEVQDLIAKASAQVQS